MSRYINLYAKRSSWAVYNTGGPYSGAYSVGYLNPSLYGGLSYKILESLGSDLYVISTEAYGRGAIYVPNDTEGLTWPYAFYTDSTYYGFANIPAPSQPGNPVPDPGTTGNYLNLHPHMRAWAIYNIGGPYVSNSKIATLSPAAYDDSRNRFIETGPVMFDIKLRHEINDSFGVTPAFDHANY